MSWEAFRLTSKSPSELYAVMSPNGVDGLIRQALVAVWNDISEADRTFKAWQERIDKVWKRNRKVWTAIKKPSPAAFFDNLMPFPADGHLRQAMVLCWMMLPRAGGRHFADVVKLMDRIFARNVEAWIADQKRFQPSVPKPKRKARREVAKKRKPRR